MDAPEAVSRAHNLIQYLQVSTLPSDPNPPPFSLVLPQNSTLHDALATHLELLRLRLGVYGAFVALVDDRYPYFIAGSVDAESGEDGDCTSDSPTCLGRDDAELQQWRAIIEQTIAEDSCSSTQTELTSIIPSPSEDDRSANLSSVCGDPHLSFYAAAPLAPKKGIHLGAVFVVDTTARKTLTAPQQALLRATAQKCMQQLESGRDGVNKERWERVNEQLGIFLGSRAIREQQLEEPPALANDDQQKRRTGEIEEVKEIARAHGRDPSKAEQQPGIPEDIFNDKQESSRVTKAETERDERIASEEEERNPRTFTAEVDDNRSRNSENPGESTYYKIFRRAAECLVEALQVDGVLFTNGLIGHHGAVQAVGELEEDLRQEMVKRPHRAKGGLVSPEPPKDGSGDDTSRQLRKDDSGEKRNGEKSTTTRTYTSPEYWRGIYVDQPAEIIGYSSRNPNVAPKTKQIKETTRGLAFLTEGQLQVLMDRYPKGSVWYIPDADGVCYRLNSGTLTEDSMEETQRLRRSLSNVRQMIFLPLTDPVTLKRLAGCFAYSTRTFPVFTDTMDVPALRGFLHVLEAEISRFDAATAVKQKESFVSSVSHELRTPIHGILGSVQLLADTSLGHFQKALADTIKTSGTALNDTLTSVLSYAKINQFERQQNKYRDRRPPDTDWALPNKMSTDFGPDTDFKGLYICTNIAMLCEEVSGVLQASQSYSNSKSSKLVDVVLNIDYEEEWKFYTEPGALRRIAINIIGNALKYTEEGSVDITLAASNIDDGDDENAPRRMITLAVKDTGKGMSKEFMEQHLFVPFTQEDATTSTGVGLGMSIVKSLVSLLAGEIKVESRVGKGTSVTVTLPMRMFDPSRSDEETPMLDLERCTLSLRKEQLSVVFFGFSDIIRKSLETYVRKWFDCQILDAVDEARPDVVIVDEGNEGVVEDVERTARSYGRLGVLLSIATGPDTLIEPMRPIQGYERCERVPRPVGPLNLGRAMWACVEKLRSPAEGHPGGTYRARSGEETQATGDEPDRNEEEKKVWEGGSEPEKMPSRTTPYTIGSGNGNGSSNDGSGGASTTSSSASQSQSARCGGAFTPDTPSPGSGSEISNNNNNNKNQHRPLPRRESSFNTASPYEDPTAQGSKLKVLVVEDNVVNKKILGAFLKKYGCKDVVFAENGKVAVEKVEACRGEGKDGKEGRAFDVVFMDLSMPVMNGFEATREIRRIERVRGSTSASSSSSSSSPHLHAPSESGPESKSEADDESPKLRRAYIVALTGLASDRDHDEAIKAGVDQFVTKPVQFEKIRGVLDGREGRGEAQGG